MSGARVAPGTCLANVATGVPLLDHLLVELAAAAVDCAQQGLEGIGVLLSGRRVKSLVRLNWSGQGSAYTLAVRIDGRTPRTLIPDSAQTTATVGVTKGHSYAFTVSALDASGMATATSSPATFVVR